MNPRVYVYVAAVDWDTATTFRQLQQLAASDQLYAQRYHHPLRLRSFVASRCLLNLALTEVEGKALDWQFGRHHNRLVLAAHQTALQVSVSHSQNWVACLLASTPYCGIDIEQRQCKPRYLAIAQRFFHPHEYQWLLTEAESSRFALFIDLWTRKEACVKAWHGGLAHHLASVYFNRAQLAPAGFPASFADCPLTLTNWSTPDWQLSAAVHLKQPRWQLRKVTL